jgi:thiamine biosynthesis protein ThiS
VIVNGEGRTVTDGVTVLGLLCALQIEPERVAVELDRSIVKKAHWDTTALREGSKLEIVQFVGGG